MSVCFYIRPYVLFGYCSYNAQPICLPTIDDIPTDETTCFITGFGDITKNPFNGESFFILGHICVHVDQLNYVHKDSLLEA